MKSPAFYKIIAILLLAALAAGGVYAAKLIHDAQLEVDQFRAVDENLKKQLADTNLQLQKNQEFLSRLQTDPDFLDRIARLRLGYVRPDELIYKFNPDPLTSTPMSGNMDSARVPLNSSPPRATNNSKPQGSAASGTTRHN